MSQQAANPMDLILANFRPQNPTQEEFIRKAEQLVKEYVTKIAPLIRDSRETVSTVMLRDLAINSCKRSGFLSRRMGHLVTEYEGACLFFDFQKGAQFQIVDKCPYVGDTAENPDHRYHLRHEGTDQDQGPSDAWKVFPLRAVLAGIKALLEQLKNDAPFSEANAELDAEFAALSE